MLDIADAPVSASEAEAIAATYADEERSRDTTFPVLGDLQISYYVTTETGGGVSAIDGTVTIIEPEDETGWLLVYGGDLSTPVPMSPGMSFAIAFIVFDGPSLHVDYCAGTTFSQ